MNEAIYLPYFTGRKRARDTAYVVPSNLQLSTNTMYFNMVQGEANPPSQPLLVDSDDEPLDFDVIEDASWLLKSPSSGQTPTTVNVSVNGFGLTPGTYVDSLEVVAPSAANSPQYVEVTLVVDEPPPVIGVDPSVFYFNAVADGDNPPSQTLYITNEGGSDLNWTATNNQAWLTPSPSSGINNLAVTLSIDITGLVVGDYYDTITVSDPAATNDPQLVEVVLSVASGLPMIQV